MATPVASSVNPPAPSSNGTLTDEFIYGLVERGSWTFGGEPRLLTYSFSLDYGVVVQTGPYAWTQTLREGFALASATWASVANFSLIESGSGTSLTASGADIAVTLTGNEMQSDPALNAVALGIFPNPVFADQLLGGLWISRANYPKPEGDIFLDHFYSGFSYLNAGGAGLEIILHELGHALGLKHPGDGGGSETPSFAGLGIAQYDAARYTVMSGNIAQGGSQSSGNAATPMPLDILAIQQIYGPNTSYRTGNDVYAPVAGAMTTIWDAGGTDTIDASGYSTGVTIDLRPGALMDFSSNTVLGVAYDNFLPGSALIENAIGGSGGDLLYGNGANNLLNGGGGADQMSGGAGNDSYVVLDALDTVIEASDTGGTDSVESLVSYALPLFVENLALTGGNAIDGTGNALANVITGNDAANRLDGGAGADSMAGGGGNDVYIVDHVADAVSEAAAAGTDAVSASASHALGANVEYLGLSGGADLQGTGNGLANIIFGNAGANLIDGGAGADLMSGGSGNDTYVVDNIGDQALEVSRSFTLVSTTSDGAQANGASQNAAIAGNGRYVAFSSYASNLLPGDGNGNSDIFVKDLLTGALVLASSNSSGASANGATFSADLSADGRYVVFETSASNLVAGDTNGYTDVFVKDVQTGATTRVSTAANGSQGNHVSGNPDISADGRYVVFHSLADNLVAGDTNLFNDAFVKDLQTGATTRVSTGSAGEQASATLGRSAVSADGRYVVFQSTAANLAAGDTNGAPDLFRKDLLTGETLLVSSASNGSIATLSDSPFLQLNGSTLGGMSGDGRYIVFSSVADNLVAGDANQQIDIFLKDLQTGATTLVSSNSAGVQGNNGSNGSTISADGRYALFNSIANNLDVADPDAAFDLYVKDLQTGLIAVVSVPLVGPKVSGGTGYSLSADGSAIVLASDAAGYAFADTNQITDVFVAQNPLVDPGGVDEVRSFIDYSLGARFENLTLTGSANIDGAGNTLDNVLTGNTGNNFLDGGEGNDALNGGDGDDALIGREGADSYNGGSGLDTVYYINPGAGSGVRIADMLSTLDQTRDATGDTFAGVERLWSLDANVNDSFRGTAGDDVIVTGGGDDDLVGRLGADVLDGGDGFDTVWYESIGGVGLVVDWLLPAASTGEAHNDILVAIERVFGAGMNDEFRGGNGNEVLAGGGGDDILDGRLGDDTLDGGAGNDIFIGGLGRDVFIGQGGNDRYIITSGAESTQSNPDIIVGFETILDKLDLTLARTGVNDSYSFTPTSEGSYLKVDLGGNGSIDLMVDVRGIIVAADLLW